MDRHNQTTVLLPKSYSTLGTSFDSSKTTNKQTSPLKSPFTYLQIKTLLLSQQLLFKLLLFCFRRDRTNTYEYKPAKQLHITIVTTVAVVATAINEMTGGMVEKSRKHKSL